MRNKEILIFSAIATAPFLDEGKVIKNAAEGSTSLFHVGRAELTSGTTPRGGTNRSRHVASLRFRSPRLAMSILMYILQNDHQDLGVARNAAMMRAETAFAHDQAATG